MRYSIYGKNLEVTDGLKDAINAKFSKLDKFFTKDTEVQITLSILREETEGGSHDPHEGEHSQG